MDSDSSEDFLDTVDYPDQNVNIENALNVVKDVTDNVNIVNVEVTPNKSTNEEDIDETVVKDTEKNIVTDSHSQLAKDIELLKTEKEIQICAKKEENIDILEENLIKNEDEIGNNNKITNSEIITSQSFLPTILDDKVEETLKQNEENEDRHKIPINTKEITKDLASNLLDTSENQTADELDEPNNTEVKIIASNEENQTNTSISSKQEEETENEPKVEILSNMVCLTESEFSKITDKIEELTNKTASNEALEYKTNLIVIEDKDKENKTLEKEDVFTECISNETITDNNLNDDEKIEECTSNEANGFREALIQGNEKKITENSIFNDVKNDNKPNLSSNGKDNREDLLKTDEKIDKVNEENKKIKEKIKYKGNLQSKMKKRDAIMIMTREVRDECTSDKVDENLKTEESYLKENNEVNPQELLKQEETAKDVDPNEIFKGFVFKKAVETQDEDENKKEVENNDPSTVTSHVLTLGQDLSNSQTSLNQRGGKYNKPAAPVPPEAIPDESETHPIKATLILKPGIIKSVPTVTEEPKTIFINKSPKLKRKSKSQKDPISRLMMLPKMFWGTKDEADASDKESSSSTRKNSASSDNSENEESEEKKVVKKKMKFGKLTHPSKRRSKNLENIEESD